MWLLQTTDSSYADDVIKHAFAGHFVDMEQLDVQLRAAVAAPDPDYFSQLLDVQIFPLVKGDLARGSWAVSFTYDPLCVKAMRSLGGYFHKHASAWQVRADPELIMERLANIAGVSSEFVFVHEQPVVIEELTTSGNEGSPISVPAASPPLGGGGGPGEEEGTGFLSTEHGHVDDMPYDRVALASLVACGVLRDYQAEGVAHMLRQSGACMGDDMGLGKSRQTVVASRMAAGRGRVLIVCPASLRLNWEREIKMVYPDARVGMIGEDRISTLAGCDWVIGNYERMGGLVRETELEFAVMAVDEAHYLKEYKSGRTRNVFLLAARIERCFVVTGTPLLNREIEMHTLLRITGHRLGSLTLAEFRKNYAGTAEKRAALAAAIQGWMIRRSKDVLKDLGDKARQFVPLSAEGLDVYKEIYGDMTLQAMPKIVRLRKCLEGLKVPYLVETVQAMGENDKLIIFCEYMSTVEALKQALASLGVGCVSLVGSDSLKRRQAAVDAFQGDASIKVFIGTTMAAGVGITLTAANIVAFASMPWTPALMRQAEDRAYRLGQIRDVLVLVPIIQGTIDEGVLQLQENKHTTEMEVVEAAKKALPGQQRAAVETVPDEVREEVLALECA
ncbi:DEAD/DEAH box helicase [Comamonas thiooxydans]|uniref:DEAD/DEAH box helicase n=1 Tax=Comamonas thiooxydans TaxID=363952 RepID=UPI000A2EA18B|nr:DEAD/DEAH box helicase [Comamonas thiooxydans]BDR09313.1 DEAD/DEAH box helicase [Comamonas thiooxydans]